MVNEPKRNILEGIENTGDVHLHDHRLRLKQRFDIIRKLGQGTYGKVQLGINKKTGQEVAIKTIKKCKIETEADLVRLRREVQIMSSVRHPNIIHIYEVFENSEKMILVMEYCSGGELYDYLSERKVLQEDEARRLFRQIATAVYYCHKHKICHRDLKLENVLLDEHGSAKIADFGLSNVFEEKRLLSTFCGSPLYASPEIVKGTPYIGPEVDCWSLGVLLYTLVYGAMPFDGSNFKRLVKQISTGDYFEPKNPSSASPLIRDMLTVDPIQRADITHICDHPWVNKGLDVSCLELAEALANETPVRLDLLLSLAPPPVSDKLVVTDEVSAVGPDGSPGRSMSVAAIDASAERRILEMVAEGGTDAIKPSPTRTIVGPEQPKRKLETTVSMDNAPSQRKKERFLRSSSKLDNMSSSQNEAVPTPVENNVHNQQELQKDISMTEQNDVREGTPKTVSPAVSKVKTPTKEIVTPSVPAEAEPENVVPKQVTNNHVGSSSPAKSSVVNSQSKKEPKPEIKPRDTILKEKNTVTKPSVGVKKKISSLTSKADDKKVLKPKEKSPPRKSTEKDSSVKKTSAEEKQTEAQNLKQPTERRKSRILDAAEKLNNLSIQPTPAAAPAVASPPPAKPKKVLIPGVSVGSFKEQFERRASLTSGAPVMEKKTSKSQTGQTTPKTLADKKMHSVDSEHPVISPPQPRQVEPANVKLQNIGIEPSQQVESVVPVLPESPKKTTVPVSEPATPAIAPNKILRPVHKSESLRETGSKKETLSNSVSLEDARKSLQQSMALLNQAKNDNNKTKNVEENSESDRQSKLKVAREIISNAIGDDNNTGKKVQRICMGGKPPVPYGAGGRSASGSLNLSSLGGSPPLSPSHQTVASPTSSSGTPPRMYRTEVHHKMDDVRNKFLPTRGGSVERIIPIHFAGESPGKSQPSTQQVSPQHSTQLPYQRNNTMPYRLSSVPRSTSVQPESERESSQPPTPFTPPVESPRSDPIKKSPREFIIPIAVEGVGYVTPRQGSLEPSETPTKLPSSNMPFGSRFPKPKRLSSLVSGGESEDEEDMHMHRLRSSRRTRADPEKDSVSSGEEDEDDEGFQLLTAENLFSTLLDRVRNLTNRLNGEEGTGFPQRHQSLFNNLHSPFFNSPHLPRKHNKHSIIRDGPSWRRSTSRDIASEFDSMFPSHTTFPRGSRRSSRKGSKHNGDQQPQQQSSNTWEHQQRDTASAPHDTQYPQEHLDLSDLDLSKIELTEKEVETLSGLTPGLSRRLQRQLLSRLPPAAARSLRRTLSAHLPPHHHPHYYSRSLSASKTDPLSCTSPVEGENSYEIEHKENIAEDDEESSVSYNSARSYADKDIRAPSDKYSDVSDVHSVKHDRSSHSVCTAERSMSPPMSESTTPQVSSNSKQTPDRSVLEKYLSPERIAVEKYPITNNDFEYTSLLSEPSYIAAYGNSSSIPVGGSLQRRSLRTPPIENGHRRISRFLRPDFFDVPREESVYVKEKRDKELETQKVLKEIRQKRHRSGESYLSNPTSPSTSTDVSQMFDSSSFRNSISPITCSPGRDKSRSVTPFYPSLDNISEHYISTTLDQQKDTSLRSALLDITKHSPANTVSHIDNANQNKVTPQPNKDTQIVRPKSYPSKPPTNLSIVNVETKENGQDTEQNSSQRSTPVFESKLLRPKSYPSTSPSPEKFFGILPKTKVIPIPSSLSKQTEVQDDETQPPAKDYEKQNISVTFNVSIPSKPPKPNNADDKKCQSPPKATAININQNGEIPSNQISTLESLAKRMVGKIENNHLEGVSATSKELLVRKSTSKETVSNVPLEKKTASDQTQMLNHTEEKPVENQSVSTVGNSLNNVKSEIDHRSPSTDADKSTGEEKKKKIVIKKKIVVKKKGTLKKNDATKSTDKPTDSEMQTKDLKDNCEKITPTKKKSVLHSIGERFEKFRNDSFNKSASQEKEIVNGESKARDQSTPIKEEKSSRIENVIRALRERSVPNNNQEEQATESGLIKRAVTITDLPTLDAPRSSTSKKTVNKVLGLFKKTDSKDATSNKGDVKGTVAPASVDGNKSSSVENDTPSGTNSLVLDKPKRPTSLLLNGIGKRVQACYNGASSDSVLVSDVNQFSREKTPVGQVKGDEIKSGKEKKGLRLDFSKLPRLNQSIFSKRSSQDLSKSRESSVCKSRESSVCKEVVAKPEEPVNVEGANVTNNNVETVLSPCVDGNANNTSSGVFSPGWSPDCDSAHFMDNDVNQNGNHVPQRNHEATSPDPENIEDRIRRRSFYSRFNEKKNKRKSLLVGPGAKEYNPSERIHSGGHSDSENNTYNYNRYDFSPTSSTKSDKMGEQLSKYSDRSECFSPTKYKNTSDTTPSYSYKSLDRNENRKYLLDPPYQPYVEKTSQYSIPRYSRTVSMHDNYDTKVPVSEPKAPSARYGRSFSLLSPGNYNTYNPRSTHSRNSAIMLRDDTDTEPYTTDSILTKIRNRKKLIAASPTTDDEDYLDTKYRSNIHSASNNEHDTSEDKVESLSP